MNLMNFLLILAVSMAVSWGTPALEFEEVPPSSEASASESWKSTTEVSGLDETYKVQTAKSEEVVPEDFFNSALEATEQPPQYATKSENNEKMSPEQDLVLEDSGTLISTNAMHTTKCFFKEAGTTKMKPQTIEKATSTTTGKQETYTTFVANKACYPDPPFTKNDTGEQAPCGIGGKHSGTADCDLNLYEVHAFHTKVTKPITAANILAACKARHMLPLCNYAASRQGRNCINWSPHGASRVAYSRAALSSSESLQNKLKVLSGKQMAKLNGNAFYTSARKASVSFPVFDRRLRRMVYRGKFPATGGHKLKEMAKQGGWTFCAKQNGCGEADAGITILNGMKAYRFEVKGGMTSNNVLATCKKKKMLPVCAKASFYVKGKCVKVPRFNQFISNPAQVWRIYGACRSLLTGAGFWTRNPASVLVNTGTRQRWSNSRTDQNGATLCTRVMKTKKKKGVNEFKGRALKKVPIPIGTSKQAAVKKCQAIGMKILCNYGGWKDSHCDAPQGNKFWSYPPHVRSMGIDNSFFKGGVYYGGKQQWYYNTGTTHQGAGQRSNKGSFTVCIGAERPKPFSFSGKVYHPVRTVLKKGKPVGFQIIAACKAKGGMKPVCSSYKSAYSNTCVLIPYMGKSSVSGNLISSLGSEMELKNMALKVFYRSPHEVLKKGQLGPNHRNRGKPTQRITTNMLNAKDYAVDVLCSKPDAPEKPFTLRGMKITPVPFKSTGRSCSHDVKAACKAKGLIPICGSPRDGRQTAPGETPQCRSIPMRPRESTRNALSPRKLRASMPWYADRIAHKYLWGSRKSCFVSATEYVGSVLNKQPAKGSAQTTLCTSGFSKCRWTENKNQVAFPSTAAATKRWVIDQKGKWRTISGSRRIRGTQIKGKFALKNLKKQCNFMVGGQAACKALQCITTKTIPKTRKSETKKSETKTSETKEPNTKKSKTKEPKTKAKLQQYQRCLKTNGPGKIDKPPDGVLKAMKEAKRLSCDQKSTGRGANLLQIAPLSVPNIALLTIGKTKSECVKTAKALVKNFKKDDKISKKRIQRKTKRLKHVPKKPSKKTKTKIKKVKTNLKNQKRNLGNTKEVLAKKKKKKNKLVLKAFKAKIAKKKAKKGKEKKAAKKKAKTAKKAADKAQKAVDETKTKIAAIKKKISGFKKTLEAFKAKSTDRSSCQKAYDRALQPLNDDLKTLQSELKKLKFTYPLKFNVNMNQLGGTSDAEIGSQLQDKKFSDLAAGIKAKNAWVKKKLNLKTKIGEANKIVTSSKKKFGKTRHKCWCTETQKVLDEWKRYSIQAQQKRTEWKKAAVMVCKGRTS